MERKLGIPRDFRVSRESFRTQSFEQKISEASHFLRRRFACEDYSRLTEDFLLFLPGKMVRREFMSSLGIPRSGQHSAKCYNL